MAPAAQSVSFPFGTTQLEGYLARPDGDGPFPGVVVIHEIVGLNENIKDIARRFAHALNSSRSVKLPSPLLAGASVPTTKPSCPCV